MKLTPGRNYGCTVAANVERLRAAGVHERIGCLVADEFLATGKRPKERTPRRHYSQYRGKPTSSRFFGVSYERITGRWRAVLNRKPQRWTAGPFDTELEAHEAVERELERRANGECGCLVADEFLATGNMPQECRKRRRPRGQCRQYRGKPTSSRFFGVYRRKNRDTFRAEINRKDHRWTAGDFDTELEAHEAVQNELKRFEEAAA